MTIDAEGLLTEVGIEYATHGKNIGAGGWLGVTCPKCGDTSNHAAVTPDGGGWTCWSCGGKGSITKLIQVLSKGNYTAIQKIVRQYSDKFYHGSHDTEMQKVPDITLPGDAMLSSGTKAYLRNRGFQPTYLQQNYGIVDGGPTGEYKFRVVVPVYMHQTLVSFVARDVTGRQELRYKNLPAIQSKIPTKQLIYNWDNIHKRAFIVEGIFDSWAMGLESCAVLGTTITTAQIRLLKTLEEGYILFDRGAKAQARAENLASVLSFCGVHVEILDLPEGVSDPAELSKQQIQQIKSMYLGG